MRIYLISAYAITILIVNIISLHNIGGYDSLLAYNQIVRSINKELISEWVPHSSYLYPFVIKFFHIFISSPKILNDFLFLSNSLIFSLITFLISKKITSSKNIQDISFLLAGLYFSNFMGVFYWDHLAFTLSLLILLLYLSNNRVVLISIIFYFLFLLKIQIFAATIISYYLILIIDLIKNKIYLKSFFKIILINIIIFIISSVLILILYSSSFFLEYFGYIYGRYTSIDPNTPFSNESIGSNYSLKNIFYRFIFPLNLNIKNISINFTIITFLLQCIFYIAYFLIFSKRDIKNRNILIYITLSHILFCSFLGRGYLTTICFMPLIFVFISEYYLIISLRKITSLLLIFTFSLLFSNEIFQYRSFFDKNTNKEDKIVSKSNFKINSPENFHYKYVKSDKKSKTMQVVKNQLNFLENQIYLNNNFFIFGHHLQFLFFIEDKDFNNKYPFTRVLDEYIFSKNFKNQRAYKLEQINLINNSEYVLVHNYEYTNDQLIRIKSIYLKEFTLFRKFNEIRIYKRNK